MIAAVEVAVEVAAVVAGVVAETDAAFGIAVANVVVAECGELVVETVVVGCDAIPAAHFPFSFEESLGEVP